MKRIFKILAAVVVGIVLLIGVIIISMGKKTNEANLWRMSEVRRK